MLYHVSEFLSSLRLNIPLRVRVCVCACKHTTLCLSIQKIYFWDVGALVTHSYAVQFVTVMILYRERKRETDRETLDCVRFVFQEKKKQLTKAAVKLRSSIEKQHTIPPQLKKKFCSLSIPKFWNRSQHTVGTYKFINIC